MNQRTAALLFIYVAACGSASSTSVVDQTDSGAQLDGSVGQDAGAPELRGKRYCEVLLLTVDSGKVHVDVYNTEGLNDCPDELWAKLDADALQAEAMVDRVLLNGPRYWMIDSAAGSMLLDETPRAFGTIEMRLAGAIDLALADVMGLGSAYQERTINRNSTFTFRAGKPVYELLNPEGDVYTMQSFSVQKMAQSEATLGTLAAALTLPQGWSFRTRTLEKDLSIVSRGAAKVVQDDLQNTYLKSSP